MFENKKILEELSDINKKLSIIISMLKSNRLKSIKGEKKDV